LLRSPAWRTCATWMDVDGRRPRTPRRIERGDRRGVGQHTTGRSRRRIQIFSVTHRSRTPTRRRAGRPLATPCRSARGNGGQPTPREFVFQGHVVRASRSLLVRTPLVVLERLRVDQDEAMRQTGRLRFDQACRYRAESAHRPAAEGLVLVQDRPHFPSRQIGVVHRVGRVEPGCLAERSGVVLRSAGAALRGRRRTLSARCR